MKPDPYYAREFILCHGLPPKFDPDSPDRVDVVGKPYRVSGGRVVMVEITMWHGGSLRWVEPCCNIYDDDGNRPFGY